MRVISRFVSTEEKCEKFEQLPYFYSQNVKICMVTLEVEAEKLCHCQGISADSLGHLPLSVHELPPY